MSEEHGPGDLVRNAKRAEQAGFDFAAISDHFFPWLEEQGHARFAWSVLGALANATDRIGLMTSVTCPIMRYHPAIIAQAAATVGLLSDNRFTLGLGAGERLNEHVIGAGLARHGQASRTPLGSGRHHPGPAGGQSDELPRDVFPPGPCPPVRPAQPKPAGGSGPSYAEVALCYAEREEDARKTAHRYFRWSVSGWPVLAELPDTDAFAAATRHVSPDVVAELVSCGPSPDRHLEAIDRYVQAGYDHLILLQIGPDSTVSSISSSASWRTPCASARRLRSPARRQWDGLRPDQLSSRFEMYASYASLSSCHSSQPDCQPPSVAPTAIRWHAAARRSSIPLASSGRSSSR